MIERNLKLVNGILCCQILIFKISLLEIILAAKMTAQFKTDFILYDKILHTKVINFVYKRIFHKTNLRLKLFLPVLFSSCAILHFPMFYSEWRNTVWMLTKQILQWRQRPSKFLSPHAMKVCNLQTYMRCDIYPVL